MHSPRSSCARRHYCLRLKNWRQRAILVVVLVLCIIFSQGLVSAETTTTETTIKSSVRVQGPLTEKEMVSTCVTTKVVETTKTSVTKETTESTFIKESTIETSIRKITSTEVELVETTVPTTVITTVTGIETEPIITVAPVTTPVETEPTTATTTTITTTTTTTTTAPITTISTTTTEKTVAIEDVEISWDMDLSERMGVSKEDFVNAVDKVGMDFLSRNAETIYDLCKKCKVNEIFIMGLIGEESGWGEADVHVYTHNYTSIMSSDGLVSYSSDEEGLEASISLLGEKYLNPEGSYFNGKNLNSVSYYYSTSGTWADNVYGCMMLVYNRMQS